MSERLGSRGELTRRVTAILIVAGAALFLFAPRAHADLYWAGFNSATGTTLGKAQLDGTSPNDLFVTGANGPCGVVSDSTHVYWANWTFGGTPHIGRADVDGTNVNQSFVTLPIGSTPCGVAVAGGFIYWANTSSGAGTTLGRVADDGVTGLNPSFVTGASGPCGVAVTQNDIYWANNGADTIGHANIDGVTGKNQSYVTGATDPCGVAVDGSHIWWANSFSGSGIGRVDLDGVSNKDAAFIPTDGAACGVAVNSSNVYWANQSAGHIGGANIDGTSPNQILVDDDDGSCGVAVDAAPIPPPNPPPNPPNPPNPPAKPANNFKVKRVKKSRRTGQLKLVVKVPGVGLLQMRGKGIRSRSKRTLKAGKVGLKVKATGSTLAALDLKGATRIRTKLTFTPDDGDGRTKTKRVTLLFAP
jgi:hypothetical protein